MAETFGRMVAAVEAGNKETAGYLQQLLAQNMQELRAHVSEQKVGDLNATSITWSPYMFDSWYLEGIMVILPVNTTSATLVIGTTTYPIQNTNTVFAPLRILVDNPTRSLTWAPASATVQPLVKLWGTAAPSMYGGKFL